MNRSNVVIQHDTIALLNNNGYEKITMNGKMKQ